MRFDPKAIETSTGLSLTLDLFPFLGDGAIDGQRLTLSSPVRKLGEWSVTGPQALTLPLEARDFQAGRLILRFDLPHATTPLSLGINRDNRALGVYIREFTLGTARQAP